MEKWEIWKGTVYDYVIHVIPVSTIWKRVTKENLATEMLVVTEIYAKFTSMPYACKEHIQVYVVAKYEFDEQRKLKIDHIVHV